jgi:tetratricopeptide (TPR) repeat protein
MIEPASITTTDPSLGDGVESAPVEATPIDLSASAPVVATEHAPEALPEPPLTAAPADLAPDQAALLGPTELADTASDGAKEPVETLATEQPEQTPETALFDAALRPSDTEPALAQLDSLPPCAADAVAVAAPRATDSAAPELVSALAAFADSGAPTTADDALELTTALAASVDSDAPRTAEMLPAVPDAPPPSAALPDAVERGFEFQRLSSLLSAPATTRVALIVGGAGVGKTRMLRQLIDLAREQSDCWIFEARCSPEGDRAYNGFDTIMAQLAAQLERASEEQRAALTVPLANPSLIRMFPMLAAHPRSGGEAVAVQRRFIDALLAFRRFWLQLGETRRVLICLDDCQFLDRDALRLLQALVCGEFGPKLLIALAYRSQPDAPEWLSAKLDHVEHEASGRSLRLDLKRVPQRTAPAPRELARRVDVAALSDAAQSASDPSALLQAARNASDALSLELAADLYQRALERHPENAQHWLADVAQAQSNAGRLEQAAQSWLALARSSQDRKHAQHCELEGAAALLHSGHEPEGRALLESVLRDCGMRWPRLPWLTSTFERARVLLGPLLSAPNAGPPRNDAAVRRFDALWAAAKEVVLLTPMAGDALSVQALREAVSLGDPSRLCWALGYEAALEANVGGPYMHRRARTLEAQVSRLAEQSGQTFDAAYARSVRGVVAWFAGRWRSSEDALRDALRLYDQSADASAHERHVLESFLVGALEAQGKQCELAALLVELRIGAEQTGHVHASAMCRLADASLPALARDQPLLAIANADAALSGFANDDFTPLRFQHCVVTVSARLYAGHHSQAFQQIEQLFRRSARAYFLRLDAVGVMLRQLRARAALAMTQQSTAADAEQLRRLAAKEAAEIAGSDSAQARGLERMIRASLACLAADRELARQLCAEASEAFERADMTLMREIARRQHALLTRDTAQRARELEQSAAFFRHAGIQNPVALTRAWFPVPTP